MRGPRSVAIARVLAVVALALSLAAVGVSKAAVGSFRAGGPVAAAPSASWVTDGGVEAMAVAGDTVYAGGGLGYVGARTGALTMFGAAAQHPQRGWPVILGGDASAGFVQAVVSDGRGGWIVGGSFRTVGGYPCPRLARIARDRRLDRRFCLGPNDGVHALAVRGKTVFVGGDFLRIGGVARVRLAAVDLASGKLLAWNAPVTGRPSWDHDDKIPPTVWALAVAGDTLVIGGFFERVGGAARANLAAVDAVTARPRPWRPTGNASYPDGTVFSLAVSGDTAYAAGEFVKLAGQSAHSFGAVDVRTGSRVRWQPRVRGTVDYMPHYVAVAGNRVYLTEYDEIVGATTIIAVTRDTGSVVKTFNVPKISGVNTWVSTLAVGPRALYIGGEFTRFGGRDVGNLAAVDLRSGRVLPWAPLANSAVGALAVANGTLAVGGTLTSAGGTRRDGLVAIDGGTGKLLPWAPRPDGDVSAMAIAGSRLYAGGAFRKIDGSSRPGLAAFDLKTRTLTSWAPRLAPNDYDLVRAMAADGNTIYVGGSFTSANGQKRQHLAAFDATTGALLPWNPQLVGGDVKKLGDIDAIDAADGRVFVAYSFDTAKGSVSGIAEIDATTGAVSDWGWSPRVEDGLAGVTALECANGVLYVGGDFSSFAGERRLGLAAVDTTTHDPLPWKPSLGGGSVIPTIGPVPPGAESLLAVGRLLAVAGEFRTAGGAPHSGIALIDGTSGTVLPWRPPAEEAPQDGATVVAASQTIIAFDGDTGGGDAISAYRLAPTQP